LIECGAVLAPLLYREPERMEGRVPIWELRRITKSFPGVVANKEVSLSLFPRQIHALLGENGSGKSTLIKIISGAYQPDRGDILKEGVPVVLASPAAARAQGIATVFQEFSLVQSLTVAENISLGRLPNRHGIVEWQRMRTRAAEILASMEVTIEPDAIVSSLSVAEQQLVEIAKALAANASLLILDEPTTALGLNEISKLHALLKRLRAAGTAILYISHRLDEVTELVDVATIMKDGRIASAASETKIAVPYLVQKMVGDIGDHYPKETNVQPEILMSVRHISSANRVRDVTFDVRRGEVLGLGGVLGSGRTEIARALFGIDHVTSGEIIWKGRKADFRSTEQAIKAGLAYVPENRKSDGLFFNLTGFPNLSIAKLERLGGMFSLRPAREIREGRRLVRELEITPAAETKTVGLLSGGNQQKIVVGRWIFAGAELFILDEPTQGIDVGAKVAVYRLINSLTREGKGVILISSDHDELLAISDRIAIVRHGRVSEVRSAARTTKVDLLQAADDEREAA
jgi:ABC-type sugar transport system ATPase subunit